MLVEVLKNALINATEVMRDDNNNNKDAPLPVRATVSSARG